MNDTKADSTSFKRDLSLTVGILLLLISLGTIISNTLLLFAIYLNPYKSFRSPPVYFIANLALADLLTGLVVDPLYAVYELGFFQGKEYQTALDVGDYASYVTVNDAICTIVVLSIDRSVAIKKPFMYRRIMTPKSVVVIVSISWIYSAFFSTFRLMGMPNEAYVMLDTHLHVTFAFLALTCLFAFIYNNLKNEKRTNLRSVANKESPDTGTQQRLQQIKSDKRLLVTIFLILLVFFLCFAPYAIFVHLEFYCEQCQGSKLYYFLSKTSEPIVYLNSALNPFIYAWRHKNFRKALVWVVRCRGRPKRYPSHEDQLRCRVTNSTEMNMDIKRT